AYDVGEWERAAFLAERVLQQSPSLASDARLVMAQSLLALGKPQDAAAALAEADFADPAAQTKALAVLATAYRDAGDWARAIDYQTRLITATEVLSAWLHELNGDAYVQLGDAEQAVESYHEAAAADARVKTRLLEKIAAVQLDAGLTDDALKTYDDLLAAAASPELAAKIHYLKGLALRDSDEKAALAEFRAATEVSATARESYLALVELIQSGETVDEFRRGLIDYQNGAYQAAADAFERALASATETSRPNTAYYLGLARLALGDYDDALTALDKALAASKDTAFQAKVLMAKARTLERAGRFAEARETYRQAQAVCPTCATAPQALWRAAEAAAAQGDRAAAASDYLWLQRLYPRDDGADNAMFRAALLYYQDRRFAEAREVCEALLARYPASDVAVAVRFWAAKSALRAARPDLAEPHLRALAQRPIPDYYTLRAASILQGQDAILPPPGNLLLGADAEAERAACLAWLTGWANQGEPYPFDRLPDDLTRDLDFRKGDAFAAIGMMEEAAERFGVVRAKWKDAPLALFQLAEHLRDLGLYRQSIACAERVLALAPSGALDTAPRYLMRLAYPTYYADLILDHAARNGLDPLLVFALVRQESRFDPVAGSWAGALGLMQIIPPTGEWIALQLGERGFRREDLLRPVVNVRFGVWYLARQMRDFGGDPLAALAAYNGGPGYARLWLSRMQEYDPDLFVETIPVAETQTYVKAILAQFAAYRAIYQPGGAQPP
ncbi:MAG: transglycosylase SLT domain-containing protein, partial [Anaerolineae bacterium]|nr:transglycosylase SLT domain-containing protein [Anaerolineae bacterium]